MPSIEDSAINRVVLFLQDNPGRCDRAVCTTCGGRLHFLLRLHQAFPNEDDLVKSLKSLKGADVSQMENDFNRMSQVINSLSEVLRKTIFETWTETIQNDIELSLAILLWTQYGKDLPQSLVYKLLLAAEPLLICSRKHRDNLRKMPYKEIELPQGLKLSIENDMREEEEKIKAAYWAAKERNDYLDSLASISFSERVSRIRADESIKFKEWRQSWSICTDVDIETLEAEEVQKLIELCEGGYYWADALKKLFDKRHQLRIAAMERFRHFYSQMEPHEQLSLLSRNLTVPIEHYPVELAQFVTSQWLSTLTKEEKDHFSDLLIHTRLRTWKKVCKRCGIDDKIT